MSYSIKVDHPAFPKDHEFAIDPLGVFKNGSSRKISEEEEQAYLDTTGMKLKDGLKNSAHVELTGTTDLKGGGDNS